MEEQGSIDLGIISEVLNKYKARLLAIIVCCTLAAMITAFLLPKQYRATTIIRVIIPKQGAVLPALEILGRGSGDASISLYIALMRSSSVLGPIIDQLGLPNKDKVDAAGFASSNLIITNTKGTDLVEVTGIGRTPEEARHISTAVVTSLQQLLPILNQFERSSTAILLNDRIAIAKKDMEQAEQKLVNFRQQENDIPNELVKVQLEREVKIAQEMYGILVNNYELIRIKEAIDSRDVQIVHPADLPKGPSSPQQLRIIAMGVMLGIMLGAMYVVVLYLREVEYISKKGKP